MVPKPESDVKKAQNPLEALFQDFSYESNLYNYTRSWGMTDTCN